MSYIGDFKLGNTFDTKFTTRQISGAPTTLSSSPVISSYVGNNTTQLTAGITLTVDFDSVTGLNNIHVVATSGNGYATATDNQLVITTGTVNSVSVVGEVVGEYSIENRRADVQFWNGTQVSSPATAGIPEVNVKNMNNVSASAITTIKAVQGIAVDGVITTVTNQLTAAQIATGIFQDTTAGDFTAANSVGKSIMNGVALGTGLTIAAVSGAVGSVTGAVGSVTGAVGSVTGAVGSVTGNVGGNVVGSVASVTGAVGSVTGAVGSVTGNVGGNVVGSVGSVTGAVGSVTGNVGGNVTGTVAGVTPSTAAQVAALLTTQITEAYRANGAAPTLAQFMSEVLGHLGESSISSTTKTINKFDHATSAETFTLDDATNPASITRAT